MEMSGNTPSSSFALLMSENTALMGSQCVEREQTDADPTNWPQLN